MTNWLKNIKQHKARPLKGVKAFNDKRRNIQCKKDEDKNRITFNGTIFLKYILGWIFLLFLKCHQKGAKEVMKC